MWKGRWKDCRNQRIGKGGREGGGKGRREEGEQARRLKGRRGTSWEKVEGAKRSGWGCME